MQNDKSKDAINKQHASLELNVSIFASDAMHIMINIINAMAASETLDIESILQNISISIFLLFLRFCIIRTLYHTELQ